MNLVVLRLHQLLCKFIVTFFCYTPLQVILIITQTIMFKLIYLLLSLLCIKVFVLFSSVFYNNFFINDDHSICTNTWLLKNSNRISLLHSSFMLPLGIGGKAEFITLINDTSMISVQVIIKWMILLIMLPAMFLEMKTSLWVTITLFLLLQTLTWRMRIKLSFTQVFKNKWKWNKIE